PESSAPTNRVAQIVDSSPSPASTSKAACPDRAHLANRARAIHRAPTSRAGSRHSDLHPAQISKKIDTGKAKRPTRTPRSTAMSNVRRAEDFAVLGKARATKEKMDKKAA